MQWRTKPNIGLACRGLALGLGFRIWGLDSRGHLILRINTHYRFVEIMRQKRPIYKQERPNDPQKRPIYKQKRPGHQIFRINTKYNSSHSSFWICVYSGNWGLDTWIYLSYVTHMNKSWHTYRWVMSHIWMSHVTHMDESCRTYYWVMSHTWMSHVAHTDESCHTNGWVMSHIWMRHVTHTDESCRVLTWSSESTRSTIIASPDISQRWTVAGSRSIITLCVCVCACVGVRVRVGGCSCFVYVRVCVCVCVCIRAHAQGCVRVCMHALALSPFLCRSLSLSVSLCSLSVFLSTLLRIAQHIMRVCECVCHTRSGQHFINYVDALVCAQRERKR